MHSGHFNAIRQAKQYCEVLVVGVIAQDEITKRKGPPVLQYEERLAIAKACKWADEICENAPYDPTIELLDRLNCSHVAHGDDMIIGPDGSDAYSMFKESNRMITFKRTEGISTTDIVGRLLLMTKNQPNQDMKKIRKYSQDSGVAVSKLDNLTAEEEKNEEVHEVQKEQQINNQKYQQQVEQAEQKVQKKLKLLNTTKRIRQFSAGNREPKEGDKIVYIDGSFDMLHVGHIQTLQKAKELGDYLIVGLHDDEIINEKKGNNYPIYSLQERVLNVLAMKYVDEVIIGAPWNINQNMIKEFNISIVVEGSMTKQKVNDQTQVTREDDPYKIPKQMGIYRIVVSACNLTTEKIVERIIDQRLKYLEIYNERKIKEI
ncbi:hypothetical protein IMG5_125800 [Ichthyophthirius multifiliis]|uniref:ethanolamine-phosphate cytidylyltransferase n=1 Tax=Ichthyophthirius multifiliis TaxID=5932 RepID=G0QVS2_ICHMU|nr:hypothetical protein IMG5_125800 [Ichthyophthirius multifiliis]EGR30689.1 hypothetical protein IMG5_125800 [Ichthyophthirius multifiliis]|eukprot:XP_004032276.1 hypothetical protein IMG5_125800 [Ichthyophthirius multifiliis]